LRGLVPSAVRGVRAPDRSRSDRAELAATCTRRGERGTGVRRLGELPNLGRPARARLPARSRHRAAPMTMPTRLSLALGAVTCCPAGALAWWPRPAGYDPAPKSCDLKGSTISARCVGESAPRAAVNEQGAAVAAWVDLRYRVRVAVADRPGGFGAAIT